MAKAKIEVMVRVERVGRRLRHVRRLADSWEVEACDALRRGRFHEARVLFSAARGVRRALDGDI